MRKLISIITAIIVLFSILFQPTQVIASIPQPPGLDTLSQVRIFSCTTVTDVPVSECETLVALYQSTDGAYWFTNANWLSTATVASWYGITVASGHVTTIHLQNNNLFGSLPSELGDLLNLQQLILLENSITGVIPPELGNLSNLLELILAHNQLSGSIPPQLGDLGNLRTLDLIFNQLSGEIPTDLGGLTNLQTLVLFANHLSGPIPMELGDLVNLTLIDLGGNQLNGMIPSVLGDLTNLDTLGLWGNQLRGAIPSELGNLTDLKWLGLGNNHLSGMVPVSFTNLVNLCELTSRNSCNSTYYGLDLGYNHLTVPATPQSLADFLAIKDPDWQLTQTAEVFLTFLPLVIK
jgi:Leucine-rich repeat (LRR) protein